MKEFIKLKDLKRLVEGRKIGFVSYCKLQTLLRNVKPDYYYSNMYGWRFDVYDLNNIVIITGYESPRGIKTIKLKEIDNFENKAMELLRSYPPYEVEKIEISKLLIQFIEINK